MTPQQTIETDTGEGWSFPNWLQANSRAIGIGAAVVVLAGVGYWFYLRSAEIKRLNAERGLNQAKQSLAAGNAGLAQTDLQRVATRYQGTPAGAQAAMLLAQMDFDLGKFDDGLKVLQPYQTASAAGASLAPVWALTGDGQLLAAKPDAAVDAYRKAAEATRLAGEAAVYRAKVARALMAAGNNAEALAQWRRIASDPDASAMHNEAEVRIGELSVTPAGKS